MASREKRKKKKSVEPGGLCGLLPKEKGKVTIPYREKKRKNESLWERKKRVPRFRSGP